MDFKDPFKLYTAASNLEAHTVADMLINEGIDAIVNEDQSGVSLWMFGTISQYHRPTVWIDKSMTAKAAELITRFEERRKKRNDPANDSGQPIRVVCEDCGRESFFPERQNGTTQDCPHCGEYVDVGELGWDESGEEAVGEEE